MKPFTPPPKMMTMPVPDLSRTPERPCTCHPDDNPPVPCQRKYALSECRTAASQSEAVEIEALETVLGLIYEIVGAPKDAPYGDLPGYVREAMRSESAAPGSTEKVQPTPRTDVAQFVGIPEMGRGPRYVVEADFARQLERELAEAHRRLEQYRYAEVEHDTLGCHIAKTGIYAEKAPVSASGALEKLEGFMGVVTALKDAYWVERDHRGIEFAHPAISPAIEAYAKEVDAFLRSVASSSDADVEAENERKREECIGRNLPANWKP